MKLHEYIRPSFKTPLKGVVILLPGRDSSITNMLFYYTMISKLWNIMFIGLDPEKEWYPQPWGAKDQAEALIGLEKSVPHLNKKIAELQSRLKIKREQIALVGYSAGGVMAIQASASSFNPYAAAVIHSGAILEPDDLIQSKHSTPMFITHGVEDICFEYYERYVPMKTALLENGYKAEFREREGDHRLLKEDVISATNFLKKIFNYES